jgi:hypothetical protein
MPYGSLCGLPGVPPVCSFPVREKIRGPMKPACTAFPRCCLQVLLEDITVEAMRPVAGVGASRPLTGHVCQGKFALRNAVRLARYSKLTSVIMIGKGSAQRKTPILTVWKFLPRRGPATVDRSSSQPGNRRVEVYSAWHITRRAHHPPAPRRLHRRRHTRT